MTEKDRVGLVLGAGGVRGIAFIAGALAVLEHDHRWDARTADVIVGTSAGSIVGGLLRAGISPMDLAAWVVGAHGDEERDHHVAPAWPPLAPLGLRDLPRPRFPPTGPLRRWCRRPWSVSPAALIAGITADGRRDAEAPMAAFDELLPQWPADSLWLCAVEQHSLARVAFGRDCPARPRAAVAASCAVPGYFAPVVVDGRRYVDGGIHSTTNADLLADAQLDRVVVVAPLAGQARLPVGIEWSVRTMARRMLHRELGPLRARGIPIAVIEPTRAVTAHLGLDFVSRSGIRDVVRDAFLDTGDRFHEPDRETFLTAA